ncbi:hypothetical protein I317_06076 [Kwoniella heveanensis CBS 569]|nr:hypothetical protein I317_06076 [Kwoniella heveanensis CBS 569]
MSSRPSTFKRPSNLSIRPPSPSPSSSSTSFQAQPPALTTPNNPTPSYTPFGAHPHASVHIQTTPNPYSPRKAPLPPSPTYSTYSYASTSTNTKGSSSGVGTSGVEVPPPLPAKNDKRLPGLPGAGSPHRTTTSASLATTAGGGGAKGWNATGVYDNKLVSSTLSHLPPLPPLSPTPTNATSAHSHALQQSHSHSHSNPYSHSHSLHPVASSSHMSSISPRPSISNPIPSGSASASGSALGSGSNPSLSTLNPSTNQGVVVFPDGTLLSDHAYHSHAHDSSGKIAENMTLAHSSPSSPWSLLTVHVLPLFAGSALKTPIEDLNHLCHSHIVATSQRYPPQRVVSLLTADLREFVGSGMLTLKAKFETLEEGKVVSRAAEVWNFFWAQVLPYVEGVFIPFTQLRDVSTNSNSTYLATLSSPIAVRHLLLSGFLLHILLPLLPRLIPLITTPISPSATTFPPPTSQELARILQMSLVLSTQARYSSFFPPTSNAGSTAGAAHRDRDEEVRENVESLGNSVRWRMKQNELELHGSAGPGSNANSPAKASPGASGSGGIAVGVGVPKRASLQRGPSLSQSGRYRRRGWRASANLGLGLNQYNGAAGGSGMGQTGTGTMSRQNSGDPSIGGNADRDRWGRPRLDEEDEDDLATHHEYAEDQGDGQRQQRAPGHGHGHHQSQYQYDNRDEATPSAMLAPPRMRRNTDSSNATSRLESYADSLQVPASMMSSATGGGSTIRGESLASYGETPSASIASATPTATGLDRIGRAGQANRDDGRGNGGPGDLMYGRPVRLGRLRAESEGSERTSGGGGVGGMMAGGNAGKDRDRDRRV